LKRQVVFVLSGDYKFSFLQKRLKKKSRHFDELSEDLKACRS
jgi:hypothetical protein